MYIPYIYIGIRKWILKSPKLIPDESDRSQTFSEASLDPQKTFPSLAYAYIYNLGKYLDKAERIKGRYFYVS